MTTRKGVGYVLPDTDGTTCSVDQPGSFLHFRDELLVEKTLCTFVQWGVLTVSAEIQETSKKY